MDAQVKIGITGGIGSGKSYVCRLLRQRGIEVYDCDSAAKRLMRTSPALRQQLCQLIGPHAYTDSGPDKAAIATFLLASKDNARAINAIVHPAVARDFEQSGLRWMECAIMYESGFNRLVDKVVAVIAPLSTRIGRIVRRDHISPEKAREWIARQWPQERVAALADFKLHNGDGDSVALELDRCLRALGAGQASGLADAASKQQEEFINR